MSLFRDAIKQFDGSGDLLEAQREVIETLEQLSITTANLFKSEINLLLAGAGSGVDKTVPISRIIDQQYIARAFSSTSSSDIGDTVKKAMTEFIDGGVTNVIGGMITLLTRALEVFLGSSSGASETQRRYFVYCTPFYIYRLDTASWFRVVTARAIQTKYTQAIAVTYSMSVVDVTKITWGDFVGIYSLQLANENLSQDEIKAAKEQMQATWNFMKGEMGLEQDATLEGY